MNRRLGSALVLAALLPLAAARACENHAFGYVHLDDTVGSVFGQGEVSLPFGDTAEGDRAPPTTPDGAATAADTAGDSSGQANGGGGTHVVVSGDTLWDLAARYCGSGEAWRDIYMANRDQIEDPHWIYPGQEFEISCAGGGANGGGGTANPNPGNSFLTHAPLPAGSFTVSSGFGPRTPPKTRTGQGSSFHEGIDLSAPQGTPIFAAGPGTIEVAEMRGGYGYAVYIRHDNGWSTRYGHMATRPAVQAGQRVEGGQQIGIVGSTGNSSGPHLHFEVRDPNGQARPPAQWMGVS